MINKRRRLLLSAMSVTNLRRFSVTVFTTPDGRTVDNKQ